MSEIYGSGGRGGGDHRPVQRAQPARDGQGDGTADRPRDEKVDGHDPDIYAILHENDHLPEPRTRQEAVRQAAVKDSPGEYYARDAYGAYDADPDAENYARGNTPDIAWRNQGNPDSPNGWGSYLREHEDGDEGEYADHGGTSAYQVPGGTLAQDGGADQPARGEHPYPGIGTSDVPHESDGPHEPDGGGGPPDGPENTADQDTETGDALRKRVTELEAANAELKAENTQLARGMAELVSENADLARPSRTFGHVWRASSEHGLTSLPDRSAKGT